MYPKRDSSLFGRGGGAGRNVSGRRRLSLFPRPKGGKKGDTPERAQSNGVIVDNSGRKSSRGMEGGSSKLLPFVSQAGESPPVFDGLPTSTDVPEASSWVVVRTTKSAGGKGSFLEE